MSTGRPRLSVLAMAAIWERVVSQVAALRRSAHLDV